jgi:hypothetical protein
VSDGALKRIGPGWSYAAEMALVELPHGVLIVRVVIILTSFIALQRGIDVWLCNNEQRSWLD